MKNTITGGLEEPELGGTSGGGGGGGASSSGGGGGGGAGGESGKWQSEEEAGITQAVKKLLSENGSIIEDYRTNSLIVTDVPSRMTIITQVVAALDVPIPQVMLEVEMLDVSKNTVDQMGVKWPATLANLDMTRFGRAVSLGGNPAGGNTLTGVGGAIASTWTLAPATWGAGHFGPAIFSLVNADIAIEFLRTQTDTKYLARPRILTLNNETAEIKIATSESIGVTTTTEASTATTSAAPERFETGVILRVTPQVNVDTGEVTMFITPVVTEATTGNTIITPAGTYRFRDPEVRSSKSMVRIKDGETVILGGLIRNQKSQTYTKLPILGDIPFLGGLFRHKDKTRDIERELLVFITPHIIKDSAVASAALPAKKNVRLAEREQGSERDSVIATSLNKFEE